MSALAIEVDRERWLPIPGAPGYEVSDMGRVRSWLPSTRWPDVPRMLTPYIDLYPLVKVCIDHQPHTRTVHTLVMLAFVGPRPDGLEIRHINGDHTDCRLANLAYGTRAENAQDRVAHGRDSNARKTHCSRGHEFTPENTARYGPKGTRRSCRKCWPIRQALRGERP